MNLHEYQAKQLLAGYGIKVPQGVVIDDPDSLRELGGRQRVVLKAQIHAGGRGKAGAIKIVNSPDEALQVATELIGSSIVTHQTGPSGKIIHKLLVEEILPIDKELYVGIVIDRKKSCPVLMASSEGGMEIEELARKLPEKIVKCHLHPYLGLQPYQARELSYLLAKSIPNISGRPTLLKEGVKLFLSLSKLFIEKDCSLLEINPLIINKEQGLMALDAKINIDDSALYRHPDLLSMRDVSQEEALEYAASKYGLSYIGLDGNIGCMVNGAGLAMATMDILKLHGGEPANFLDVGGGASKEQVSHAFKLLVSNKNVKAILVNIFGGIMKCDVIAEGITTAIKEVGLSLPMVVRLEGTNVELGKKTLKESGLNIISADTMDEAAKRIVHLANSNNQAPNSK
ncbi:MAG: ADP-forming succinate--CoA ligase subunit beta [Planctomycetota bacterium]|nr:ADP-forming succinate--CoA ligase subunit beta [Planctomycetota bacterium]